MSENGCPECEHCKQKAKDHVCNLCGESCMLYRGDGFLDVGGLDHARATGGYFSTPGNGGGALDDTLAYTFSICEFCLDWLFEQFKVPVQVTCYMGTSTEPLPWVPAADRVRQDEWRGQKEKFFAEQERRAKAREAKGNT